MILLASRHDSRSTHDQWGAYVPFPGFVTRRRSENNGKTYHLLNPHCRFAWLAKPGDNGPDEIDVQHYPRVARADSGARVMVFA